MAKTDDGWDVVSEDFPTKVTFDEIGDEFIGRFQRKQKVSSGDNSFNVYIFTEGSVNGTEGDDGERFSVNENARLRDALQKVRPGMLVRIRYVADIETNQDNPMKDYEVATRR